MRRQKQLTLYNVLARDVHVLKTSCTKMAHFLVLWTNGDDSERIAALITKMALPKDADITVKEYVGEKLKFCKLNGIPVIQVPKSKKAGARGRYLKCFLSFLYRVPKDSVLLQLDYAPGNTTPEVKYLIEASGRRAMFTPAETSSLVQVSSS